MRKIKVSKSRVAAAALLLLVLVVGILFPVSGSSAKYTTQVSLNGKINYQFDNTLAASLKVDGTDTYKLIPGTKLTPGAKVAVTGRTETPAYLFVEITGGAFSVPLTADWIPLADDVTGPHGGKVYVYLGRSFNVDVAAPVFSEKTLDSTPLTENYDLNVYAYLAEQRDPGDSAVTVFGYRENWRSTLTAPIATEKFVPVHVSANVNGDYTVQNTGNIDAYIRAKVVLNRVDEAGNIEADGAVPTLNVPADWTKVGDYLYYNGTVASNGKVAPEGSTTAPFDPAEVAEGVQITVIAEAIQAEGGAAADAWGVTWNGTAWTTP